MDYMFFKNHFSSVFKIIEKNYVTKNKIEFESSFILPLNEVTES